MTYYIILTLTTDFVETPCTGNACVANSKRTHISRRLADHLGLMKDTKDVFVMFRNKQQRWKIATQPMTVSFTENETQQSVLCYPVINMEPNDAYYEMVVGDDIMKSSPYTVNTHQLTRQVNSQCPLLEMLWGKAETPNPGPGYLPENQGIPDQNIQTVKISISDVPPSFNDFIEYDLYTSLLYRKAAFNRVTRQFFLMELNNQCLLFENVPSNFEQKFEASLVDRESTDRAIQNISNYLKNGQKTMDFPVTTLKMNTRVQYIILNSTA
jgi:hypothetical protein